MFMRSCCHLESYYHHVRVLWMHPTPKREKEVMTFLKARPSLQECSMSYTRYDQCWSFGSDVLCNVKCKKNHLPNSPIPIDNI